MTKSDELSDPAERITWQVAIGLRQPLLTGWTRVIESQMAEAARRLPVISLINMTAVVLVAVALWSPASALPLLLWVLVFALASGIIARTAYAGWRSGEPKARVEPPHWSMARGIIVGTLWALPPAFFTASASEMQRLAICLICAGMMAGAAITSATLPLGMACALLATSAGLSAMMVQSGSANALALLPQLYAAALILGGVASSRASMRRCWSELEIAENREVVSLLLREFDEEDADWLWQTDAMGALTDVSQRLADAAGATPAQLEGRSLTHLLSGPDNAASHRSSGLSRLTELLDRGESFVDVQLPVTLTGDERWWSLSASPRTGPEGEYLGFRGKGSDVTEQRRSAERINRMAKFDALTGLANRDHFMEKLRKALARINRSGRDEGQSCVLLLVDLDRFKPVNDTLGHPVGDRVLKLVAERLRALLIDGEIAGRLGGDEFALLLPSVTDQQRLETLCGHVLARLRDPFEVDGHVIRIGASLGSARAPADGRSVEMLVRHADLALYSAKDGGRGAHRRYEPVLLDAINRRRDIEAGLRLALDTGGLHLLYQPIVDARGDTIRGFEALVRWTDPALGEVSPAEFIPIAEEARLSSRIGEWVLRTACTDAASWPEHIRVGVNLSAEQLGDRQLANTVLSALAHSGLTPRRLMLELSEAVFLRGGAEVLAVMTALQSIGVGIALDDFGTGHAALAYISTGGIHTIKIDRALIRGVGEGRTASIALVRAVIALADSLDVTTVAEGTETRIEMDAVTALGVGFVQGHLIGMPMPERTVQALVAARRRAAAAG